MASTKQADREKKTGKKSTTAATLAVILSMQEPEKKILGPRQRRDWRKGGVDQPPWVKKRTYF